MPRMEKAKIVNRAGNWSFEEISMLVEFVMQNRHKLVGTSNKSNANVEKTKAHYWKMCSSVLVENGCSLRDWQKIRKKWQTISCDARAYHRDCNRTGKHSFIYLIKIKFKIKKGCTFNYDTFWVF